MTIKLNKCINPTCNVMIPDNQMQYFWGFCTQRCLVEAPRSVLPKGLTSDRLTEFDKNGEGLRYNRDKERITLIPFEVLKALAKHYTVGAKKYEDNNWRKGLKYSDTMDCAMRHIIAFQTGEDIDLETGSSHLIAAIWNLVALELFQIYPERYSRFDDRWKAGPFGDINPPDMFQPLGKEEFRKETTGKFKSTRVETDLTGQKEENEK